MNINMEDIITRREGVVSVVMDTGALYQCVVVGAGYFSENERIRNRGLHFYTHFMVAAGGKGCDLLL
jgi:hypothetical protein